MMQQCIIVYRPHGALKNKTQFIGPFPSYYEAETFLVENVLPLGLNGDRSDSQGCRYIEFLIPPAGAAKENN